MFFSFHNVKMDLYLSLKTLVEHKFFVRLQFAHSNARINFYY